MKRRPLLAILCLLMTAPLLCLIACGGGVASTESGEDTTPQGTEPPAESMTETETEPVTETETEGETEEPYEILLPGEVTPTDIYPTPVEVNYGEQLLNLSRVNLPEEVASYADRLTAKGVQVSANGANVKVEIRALSELAYGAEEGYILTVNEDGVKIEAQTETGVHYAMVTLLQLIGEDASCPSVTVKDAPRNEWRGVIEGFYGEPWTDEFRKELFTFMGDYKLNAYIYAPKDDAKHRNLWRTRYTSSELGRLSRLVSAANENHVKFIYAISPGLDITLSGAGYDRDFEKLVEKCQQMYDLGVRDFAIFLDDIPPANLDAQGHAKLLNDFQTRFVETHEGMSNLIAITPEYCDAFLTSYTDEIAPLIDKDIVLMWTGTGVSPFYNNNASMNKIVQKYDREVLIWWNYPVNDYAANNLFMDAFGNLSNDIHETTTGVIANPMNQGYASMVPLFTTSEFLWNPEVYNRTTSLEAACKALMPDAYEALLDFVAMNSANVINNYTDSVEVKGLLDAFRRGYGAEDRNNLKAYFERMIQNADAILASENQKLATELGGWLAKYRAYGEMGVLYVAMEEAYAAGQGAGVIQGYVDQYRAIQQSQADNACIVSGRVMQTMGGTSYSGSGVLAPFFENLDTRINRLLQ